MRPAETPIWPQARTGVPETHVARPRTGKAWLWERLACHMHWRSGMEPNETARLEKALVVAACFPFLMMGLLFMFA
jgi:hypothetical protein